VLALLVGCLVYLIWKVIHRMALCVLHWQPEVADLFGVSRLADVCTCNSVVHVGGCCRCDVCTCSSFVGIVRVMSVLITLL